MDNTFPIPILYKEKAGNPYQHEVMNLLAFIKAFHPLPLVDEGLLHVSRSMPNLYAISWTSG